MDYQINYGFTGDAKRIHIWQIWMKRIGYLALCIMLIVTLSWISGANHAITVSAMEDMAEMLRQGEAFTDAFSEFCMDILQGAECG